MYHYVYKTTNLINNKFYIGAHSSESLNDVYLGSGEVLKKAINKYGKQNFSRDIVSMFDSRELMFDFEELIISQYLGNAECYNISQGGDSGPSMKGELNFHYNKKGELSPNYGLKRSEETRLKMSIARKNRIITNETKERISKAKKGIKVSKRGPMSEDMKLKISEARKGIIGKPSGWSHSEQTKAKMRQRWKERKSSKEVI